MKRFVLILAAVLFCHPVVADTIMGRVVGVTDGDTITVLDSSQRTHKVRLAGIDAPEKAQPFGQRSKQFLSGMVYGKEVSVQFNGLDRYGRIIGKVNLPGLGDVGLAQISSGMAWHYKHYSNDSAYAAAEDMAKRVGRGVWAHQSPISPLGPGLLANQSPIPPWEWRHTKRK